MSPSAVRSRTRKSCWKASVAEIAYVALGSNIGNRAAFLVMARTALATLRSGRLLAASRVEETAPFGPVAQGPYLNQMVALSTTLPPLTLLDELHRVERALGRVRDVRWGPRTIDLDLVQYGSHTLELPTLHLPHPGVESRDFWQRELAELAVLLKGVA
jgi:2-amino-4-hydroxy-6-hydroxymethyldihydropteridine diphosphokinase